MTHIVPKTFNATNLSSNATSLCGLDCSYYLDYNNFVNTPQSLTDFGIPDGSNGDVLTTDGSGNFTFQTMDPNKFIDGGAAASVFSPAERTVTGGGA